MTPKQLYEAINEHLLQDAKPSAYFNSLEEPLFLQAFPFTMLSHLKNIPQSPQHHPEGDVWKHTMLVIDEAAAVKSQSSDQRAFMWAALLHDVGKADTTKTRKGRITAYDHDKVGGQLAEKFLQAFTDDEAFIKQVTGLVRWHMQILFVVKSMPFADIKMMKQQTKIEDVALLGLCDRLGRLNIDRAAEQQNIALFVQKCSQADT